jgi:hypothetical protein
MDSTKLSSIFLIASMLLTGKKAKPTLEISREI